MKDTHAMRALLRIAAIPAMVIASVAIGGVLTAAAFDGTPAAAAAAAVQPAIVSFIVREADSPAATAHRAGSATANGRASWTVSYTTDAAPDAVAAAWHRSFADASRLDSLWATAVIADTGAGATTRVTLMVYDDQIGADGWIARAHDGQ
jgi:hypothetical protein